MSDTRGFRYALAPVKEQCVWELNEVMLELGVLNLQVAEHHARLQGLAQQFEAVRLQASSAGQALDLTMRRMAHHYLSEVQQQIVAGRHQVRELEQSREQTVARSQRLRKFADHLDEHQAKELAEHGRAMAQKGFRDADDIWLQRVNWRKTQ